MTFRSIRGAALATVLLTAAAPLQGQSVLLRLAPQEGLVSRYVLEMENYMSAPMMSSDQPMMVGEIYTTQTVVGVEGDVVEYRVVTDSADIRSPAMPGMAQQMPDLTGQVQMMKMDTRGRLVEIPGADTLSAEAQQIMTRMNGFGLELPENEVSPGDTWTANIQTDTPAGPNGRVNMTMDITYTLVSVSGDMATIEFEGPLTMSGSQAGMTMDGSGSMSGTMVFDVARGRLASTDTQMEFDMGMQGMTMTMSQTMNMQLLGS